MNINTALSWAVAVANNNDYTYEWGAGHGVSWTYSGKTFDCSSFVSFALYNGGLKLNTQFATSNEVEVLEKLGFEKITFLKDSCKKGDVLWVDGHTEFVLDVNLNDVALVGARTDTLPLDEQIAVHSLGSSVYTYILRYNSDRPINPPNPPINPPNPPINSFTYKRKQMVFVYPRQK